MAIAAALAISRENVPNFATAFAENARFYSENFADVHLWTTTLDWTRCLVIVNFCV